MFVVKHASFLALIILTVMSDAQSQNLPTDEILEMSPIPDSNADIMVIGGRPVRQRDWPTTFRLRRASSADEYNCTATMIGDRVLITAAHCVEHQSRGVITLTEENLQVQCFNHDQFGDWQACRSKRSPRDIVGCTADIALCLTNHPIHSTIDKFERLRPGSSPLRPGSKVRFLGYGCTAPPSGGELPRPSNILTIGQTMIKSLSVPGASRNPENTYDEYVSSEGGAVICIRDSGGAGYLTDEARNREVLLISSRTDLESKNWFVGLNDEHIMNFILKFKKVHNISICGLDSEAQNCLP